VTREKAIALCRPGFLKRLRRLVELGRTLFVVHPKFSRSLLVRCYVFGLCPPELRLKP